MTTATWKERLGYYAMKWYRHQFRDGNALVWLFIVFLTIVQGFLVLAFLAEQGSESAAAISSLYQIIIWLGVAILLGAQVILAAVIFEVWYHVGDVSEETIEEIKEATA